MENRIDAAHIGCGSCQSSIGMNNMRQNAYMMAHPNKVNLARPLALPHRRGFVLHSTCVQQREQGIQQYTMGCTRCVKARTAVEQGSE